MGKIWDRKPARKSRIRQSRLKGGGRGAQPMKGVHLKILGRFWSEQGDNEKGNIKCIDKKTWNSVETEGSRLDQFWKIRCTCYSKELAGSLRIRHIRPPDRCTEVWPTRVPERERRREKKATDDFKIRKTKFGLIIPKRNIAWCTIYANW